MGAYLEHVFAYHYYTVDDRSDLSREIEALLAFNNGGPGSFSMTYSPEEASLVVRVQRQDPILKAQRSSGPAGPLRFLPVRSLKIVTPGTFATKEIRNLAIETLDISECEHVQVSNTISLPQLRQIRMREGQLKTKTLHQWIVTNEPIEFIVVD